LHLIFDSYIRQSQLQFGCSVTNPPSIKGAIFFENHNPFLPNQKNTQKRTSKTKKQKTKDKKGENSS
jgi:hypothetical protein